MKRITFLFPFLTILSFLFQSCSSGPDNTTIEKVSATVDSTEFTVFSNQQYNKALISKLEKTVIEHGNTPAEVAVLQKAIKADEVSLTLLALIGETKGKIVNTTGGMERDAEKKSVYKGASDIGVSEQILYGKEGAHDGAAFLLKSKLDQYVADANMLAGTIVLEKIEFDPSSYKGKAMIFSVSDLTLLEAKVTAYEKTVLELLTASIIALD